RSSVETGSCPSASPRNTTRRYSAESTSSARSARSSEPSSRSSNPRSSSRRQPRLERRWSSARIRSPAGLVTSVACSRTRRSVRGSSRKPSSSSSRTARSSRSGSSAKILAATARRTRRSRSAAPSKGSTSEPPASGSAIALIVKSRVARSSSRVPRSGVKSTVRPSPSATRHAPCRSESGKGAPPEALAYANAAARGSQHAMSRSTTGRPSSRSRTAPPTIQASSPARSSRASSSTDDPPDRALGPADDAAGELVVDRPGRARVLLEQQAVADERHRRSDRQLAVELDGERVHRDRADDAPALTGDEHLGPREVAAEAVAVADRDEPDPRGPVGDEPAPVAGALPRLEPLHAGELASPGEHGLEPVVGRVGPERREAVERDPAASRAEARRRQAERGRAVRRVQQHAGVRPRDLSAEDLELPLGEGRVAVRGREVRHQPDDVRRQRRQSVE